uniref:Uncharacterized protein n=1 Tax=Panagrellus redivivus TaxID=6233 RepID=A0A7E4W894_PANRE
MHRLTLCPVVHCFQKVDRPSAYGLRGKGIDRRSVNTMSSDTAPVGFFGVDTVYGVGVCRLCLPSRILKLLTV